MGNGNGGLPGVPQPIPQPSSREVVSAGKAVSR